MTTSKSSEAKEFWNYLKYIYRKVKKHKEKRKQNPGWINGKRKL